MTHLPSSLLLFDFLVMSSAFFASIFNSIMFVTSKPSPKHICLSISITYVIIFTINFLISCVFRLSEHKNRFFVFVTYILRLAQTNKKVWTNEWSTYIVRRTTDKKAHRVLWVALMYVSVYALTYGFVFFTSFGFLWIMLKSFIAFSCSLLLLLLRSWIWIWCL